MNKVSVFHIGPQKSATTWLYHCFKQHPDIAEGKTDAINYLDIHHYKGDDWYHTQFNNNENRQKVLIDMTPSYIRSLNVPQRLYNYNPDAKIIICLREPISRAFSHYWHSKKKSEIDLPFDRLFRNYDCFNSWIETGYYADHIERFLKYFDRSNIHIQMFDELSINPKAFLDKTLNFVGVDSLNFNPNVLDRRVNVAKPQKTKNTIKRELIYQKLRIVEPMHKARCLMEKLGIVGALNQETLQDIDISIIEDLLELYEPHTRKLEKLIDIDLKSWRSI